MLRARRERVKTAAITALVAVVCALLVSRIPFSARYRIEAADLSGWKLVTGEPDGPALVALQPPKNLVSDLFRQATEHSKPALVAPPQALVPLVLRDEYSDSLQGVLSTEDIMDLARDAGVETARFEPVCIIERQTGSAARFIALFDSPSFERFRLQLSPLFPEHAGAAPFDPNALRPMLTIAATDAAAARSWPSGVEPTTECNNALSVN